MSSRCAGGQTEGRTEVTGRQGRRREELLDDLWEKRRYWKLKEAELDRTLWEFALKGAVEQFKTNARMV